MQQQRGWRRRGALGKRIARDWIPGPVWGYGSPQMPALRPSGWDLAALAVIIAVTVAHVSFLLADGRLPQDPGLYYRSLPDLYDAWRALDLRTLSHGLVSSSGWYNALIALVMVATGPSALAFAAFDVLWVTVILVMVVIIGRKLGGGAAGLASVCIAGAMPVIFLSGRTAWIHTPETALVLAVLAIWLHDRTLCRWRSTLGIGILGALTVALRPSGLVWVATLIPLIPLHAPRRWRRTVVIGALWAASLAVPLEQLGNYMAAKAAARDRYAAHLPGLWEQLQSNLGFYPFLVGVIGIAFHLLRRPRKVEPVAVLLVSWAGISLGLWALFQAGMDNFPLIAPAVAILGGWGLARRWPWPALAAVPVFLLTYVPQWIPPSSLRSFHRVPGVGAYIFGGDVRNHYRVWQRYGWSDLSALIDATCPEATPYSPCVIAIDQGLLQPFTEDVGELELFLAEADHIRLVDIRETSSLPSSLSIDALVEYNCQGKTDRDWRERFPNSGANLATLLEGGMLPVWVRAASSECEVLWMTPEGALADPEALPTTGTHVENPQLPGNTIKPPLPGDPPQ